MRMGTMIGPPLRKMLMGFMIVESCVMPRFFGERIGILVEIEIPSQDKIETQSQEAFSYSILELVSRALDPSPARIRACSAAPAGGGGPCRKRDL